MTEFSIRYRLPVITTLCMDYFEERINLKTCVPLYRAFKHRKEHPINRKLFFYLLTNFEKIVDNCFDFFSIDYEDIKGLVESNHLNISGEMKVFRILIKWTQFSLRQRIGHLRELLSNSFRFARLHLAELQLISKHPLIRSNIELERTMKHISDQYRKLRIRKDGNNRHCDDSILIAAPRVPQFSLIVHGGCTENSMASEIESYSFHTNQWRILPTKQSELSERYYHSVETLNGKYYIIGGSDASNLKRSIVELDFETGSCRELAEMSEYRCYVSTAVLDGQIYAMGGLNGTDRLSSAERYDPRTNTWQALPEMNVVRSDAAACVHQGKIYIAGGLNSLTIEASMECYDPATNSWLLMESMLSNRSSFSLVSYNDQLYALGGNDGFDRLPYVEVYDFRSNQWLPIEPMMGKRSTFKAIVLNDELYAVGGYDGSHACGTVEKFNHKTQAWISVGRLNVPRTAFGLVSFKEY